MLLPMILTTYIDESGTHNSSAISVMAGYVAASAQWENFDADWTSLVQKAGAHHIHAVDLFKRANHFKGWKADDVNSLAVSLNSVISKNLPLGFAAIIRDDDYKAIYGAGPHPRRPQKDTKYGVCFRACLAFLPSFIASELKLDSQSIPTKQTTINFVLEDGHKNVGDARRLFDKYKADVLPEWKNLVGTMDTSTKNIAATQAADFLAYTVYRLECIEHGQAPSVIEKSSNIADISLGDSHIQNNPMRQEEPMIFRIPISQEILQALKDDLFALAAERSSLHVPRR